MAMENTSREEIKRIVEAQRGFFRSGKTLDLKFRKENLRALKRAMEKWEKPLADALWQDLHKSYEEAYLTELSIMLGEIRNHISHLSKWAAPKRVCTPLKMFPSRSKVVQEPLGCSLIMAPWNYPVQLLLNPLVGAISAGCTAVLKPSPYVPNVSKVLEERYDIIFFTGSPDLGHRVMRAASEHLTPVVLELGGKSPCIVDRDANIAMAARRIAWGKSLNAGQTCIAPDYLLVHAEVKERLIEALKKEFEHLLGKNPQEAKHFVRIVSDKAFERLTGYLKDGNVRIGGTYDSKERYIHPTVLDDVKEDSTIMQEEIFGPLFPLLTFNTTDEAIDFVNKREKPLALYYFGENGDNIRRVLRYTSSGGACINDTIMHIANENLPFGGVGNSGMSSYHGKESFRVFSHQRAVVTTPTWLDLPFRYMPYKFFGMVKGML